MRAQNTTSVSSIVATDLKLLIEASPESFDVVLFRANSEAMEVVAIGDDEVGSLEERERRIDYEAPVIVSALEPTVDIVGYPMLNSGTGYGLNQDQGQYKLLISERVTRQSVIAFPVAQHDGTHVVRIMYVLAAETLGRKAPAGYVYTLIPYVGGGEQIENVSPDKSSIIEYVERLLASTSIPENPDVGGGEDAENSGENGDQSDDDEVGSL